MPDKEILAKTKKNSREKKKVEVKEKKKAKVEVVKKKKRVKAEAAKEKMRIEAKTMVRTKIKDRAAKNIKSLLQTEQIRKRKATLFNDSIAKKK